MNATQTQPETETATPSQASAAGKAGISMASINFWLDAGLFVTIIFVMWVSIILQFVFPAQAAATPGWKLWGMTFDEWRNAQFVSLCLFALLAVEHVVLHWNWVCSILATRILGLKKPDEASQAVYGVGTFIVILVLTMATLLAATFSVQAPP